MVSPHLEGSRGRRYTRGIQRWNFLTCTRMWHTCGPLHLFRSFPRWQIARWFHGVYMYISVREIAAAFFWYLPRYFGDFIFFLVYDPFRLNTERTTKYILTTCAGNRLRTITSDQAACNNSSLLNSSVISPDRNYWEVTNLLFVSPGL